MKRILVLTAIVLMSALTYAKAPEKKEPVAQTAPATDAAKPASPLDTGAASPGTEKVVPKAPYDSTKAQLWNEKQRNFQLQAAQLQVQFQNGMKDLGEKFNEMEGNITGWVAAVRKDNGWDDSYTWNRDNDTWVHSTKPAAPAPPADPNKK